MNKRTTRITNKETARNLLDLAESFQENLILQLEDARHTEDDQTIEDLRLTIGEVLAEIGSKILFPIYRKHPEMAPEKLKDFVKPFVQSGGRGLTD